MGEFSQRVQAAAHEMLAENPEASITPVREYLDAPVE
jgi:hypothetical protein